MIPWYNIHMKNEFTVDTLVSRLASEQVQYILDSIDMNLRNETGHADIDLRQIIRFLISDGMCQ
jgi:tRNA A37 threonylcarbamoyladenosine dehydratase